MQWSRNVLNGGNGSCLHAIAQFCHSSQKKEEIYFLVLIFTFRSVCIKPVRTPFSKGPICLARGDHQELVSRIFPRLQDTLLFGAGGVTVPMLLHHPDTGPLKQTPGAETGTGPLSGVKTLGQSIHLVLPCTRFPKYTARALLLQNGTKSIIYVLFRTFLT